MRICVLQQRAAVAFLGLCKRRRFSSGRFFRFWQARSDIRKQGRELFGNTATRRAIVDPARVRVATPLLGHRTFTTTEPHYQQARRSTHIALTSRCFSARRNGHEDIAKVDDEKVRIISDKAILAGVVAGRQIGEGRVRGFIELLTPDSSSDAPFG